MITSDNRIPHLIRFIKKNNPNTHNKDAEPDIVASQFSSGSKEYIKWVIEQCTPKTDSNDSTDDGEDDATNV